MGFFSPWKEREKEKRKRKRKKEKVRKKRKEKLEICLGIVHSIIVSFFNLCNSDLVVAGLLLLPL